jgi:hypothetical protein
MGSIDLNVHDRFGKRYWEYAIQESELKLVKRTA